MTGRAPTTLAIATVSLLLSACSIFAPASDEPAASSDDLSAWPVTGAEDTIYISGTIESASGATLTGADTPYGPAALTMTSGCIGGGPEPMSQRPIPTGDGITLVVGSGYLAVWDATGIPEAGSTMLVALHFADAADVIVPAKVLPATVEEPAPAASREGCSG